MKHGCSTLSAVQLDGGWARLCMKYLPLLAVILLMVKGSQGNMM